jgi:archaellum biogenesis ATPase FlaH
MGFHTINYDEILEKLDRVKSWYAQNNIKDDKGTLDEICSHIRTLNDHHKNNRIQELIAGSKENMNIFTYPLIESDTYIDIYESFSKDAISKSLKDKLREILLRIPLVPMDEDAGANNILARNTLFELLIASKLKKNNIVIKDYDDITFLYDDCIINTQCKRLHSHNKVLENTKKAYKQIQNCLKKYDSNAKGIICLSIEKIAGKEEEILEEDSVDEISPSTERIAEKEGRILEVSEESEIGPSMNAEIENFINLYSQRWLENVDTRIIGVLIYFPAAVFIKDISLLTSASLIGVCPLARPEYLQSRDYNLVIDLANILRLD